MRIKLDDFDYEVISTCILKESMLTEDEVGRLYVTSSNINSIWFEETTDYGIGVLSIEFHSGAVYEYYKFPSTVFDRFVRAPSYGKFLWKYIRGKYPYQRVSHTPYIPKSELESIADRITSTTFWKNAIKNDTWLYFDSTEMVNTFMIMNIKLDRKRTPFDTARKTVNQLSQNKFGYKIRDGLIATNNTFGKTAHSRMYTILPLDNNYKIFYNPRVVDFIDEYADKINNSIDPAFLANEYIEGVKQIKRVPKIVTRREFMLYGDWIVLNIGTLRKIMDGL